MTAAQQAFAVVELAIARGPVPGAAALVREGEADDVACFGRTEAGGPAPTADTWYDLASLTKVLCTVPLLMRAIVEGRLDPRAPLRACLPETAWMQASPNLGDVTVLELATHTSGLPPWEPLYTLGLARETLLARVLQTPLKGPRGQIAYSDLGFIILGHLLERLAGAPLEEQARALYLSVGLDKSLAFETPPDATVAPTERCPWRGRVLRGEVHDENAAALHGVAGHAGLFGTVRGVAGLARALLDGRLLSPAGRAFLLRMHARHGEERRAFGWLLAFPGWSGGDLCGPDTIGHTGFTGTGVWTDPASGRCAVLLTNRVHPSRHVEPDGIHGLRRAFNNAAFGG